MFENKIIYSASSHYYQGLFLLQPVTAPHHINIESNFPNQRITQKAIRDKITVAVIVNWSELH